MHDTIQASLLSTFEFGYEVVSNEVTKMIIARSVHDSRLAAAQVSYC